MSEIHEVSVDDIADPPVIYPRDKEHAEEILEAVNSYDRLRAENAMLYATLRDYADPDHWGEDYECGLGPSPAREALAKVKL